MGQPASLKQPRTARIFVGNETPTIMEFALPFNAKTPQTKRFRMLKRISPSISKDVHTQSRITLSGQPRHVLAGAMRAPHNVFTARCVPGGTPHARKKTHR